MKRPSTVPSDASWDENDREWVSAETDDDGRKHGLVRYFRPDGTLCCETEFEEDVPHGRFQRFHENGEVSREGRFLRGTLDGVDSFVRCAEPTTEKFPDNVPEAAWRCEMIYRGGRVVGGRLFDADGDLLGSFGEAKEEDGDEDGDEDEDEDEDEGDGDEDEQEEEGPSGPPERASGVPESASWDEDSERWEDGPKNALGQKHGDWRTWDVEGRPRGQARYAEDWPLEIKTLHEDGSVEEHNTYQPGGVPIRRMKRRGPDGESIGGGIPDEVQSVEYDFDAHGYMTEFRFLGARGELIERTEIYKDASNQIDQERYPNLEAASREWREKGKEFSTGINAWLDILYKEERENEEPEPTDERGHMERVVVDAIEQLNKKGAHAELRRMFPPAIEPFGPAFFGKYGGDVSTIIALSHDTFSARVGDKLYFVDGASIHLETGVLAVGASPDKRWFAIAFPDRIEVRSSWNGPATARYAYPTAYDLTVQRAHPELKTPAFRDPRFLGITALHVTPDGKRVILVTGEGIYAIGGSGAQILFPAREQLEQYASEAEGELTLDINFPNAAMDPQGRFVLVGGMFRRGIFADLLAYEVKPDRLVPHASSGAQAFFPRLAAFHDKHPMIAYAAVLYATFSNMGHAMPNTTFRLSRKQLEAGGRIEEFDGGVMRGPGMIEALLPYGDGFLCGGSDGYIWHMSATESGQRLGYVHVGGSVHSLDLSPDGKTLYVGNTLGMVIRLALGEARDPMLITDMKVVDRQRWLFWKTFPPMLW